MIQSDRIIPNPIPVTGSDRHACVAIPSDDVTPCAVVSCDVTDQDSLIVRAPSDDLCPAIVHAQVIVINAIAGIARVENFHRGAAVPSHDIIAANPTALNSRSKEDSSRSISVAGRRLASRVGSDAVVFEKIVVGDKPGGHLFDRLTQIDAIVNAGNRAAPDLVVTTLNADPSAEGCA